MELLVADQLSLRLGTSRLLVLALSGAHAVAAAGLGLSPLAYPWVILGCLGLAGHLVVVLRRDAWRTATGSIVGLELRADRSVRVCFSGELWSDSRIAGSSFTSPTLAIVNLRLAGQGPERAVLIARDALDADTFRRLRVWLGWRYRGNAKVEGDAGP